MGQSSTSRNITTKRAGAAVDYQALDVGDQITRRNNSSVAIFPGRFVVRDTDDDSCKIQDSGVVLGAGEFYHGLVTDNENRERNQGSTATDGYVENALVPIARTSRFYAECEEAVAEGDTVWVRFVAGAGGSVIGLVRGDVDTASAEAVNAKFAETITAPGLVAIDLNMPQV